jgi:type I restriction enzyme, S subunit
MGNDVHCILWETAGGKAPAHWEFFKIEDLLENPKSISVGVMYPGKNTPDGVPLIKVSDVKNGSITSKPTFCISSEVDEEYKRTRLNGTELLITLVGNPGDCVVVNEDMAGWNAARALAVVRLADPELRPWLRYVLLSGPAKHLIDARLNTTVQKTLNLKDIRRLGLPIPPKKERDAISDMMSKFDDKIELNRRMNATLEGMAQALFKSWFVDFDPVMDNALAVGNPIPDELADRAATRRKALADGTANRESAKQFPAAFQLTEEMGWIPDGWEVSTIGNEAETVGGGTPSTKNPTFWEDGECPWVTPKDFSPLKDKVLLSSSRYLTSEGLKKVSSGLLPKGTVLMSSRAPVGYLAITQIETAINQGFIAMKCNGRLPPEYILQWANSIMDNIKQTSSGSTFAEISKKAFRPFKVLVPMRDSLDAYANVVTQIYARITDNVAENETLTSLRDVLLPKLISGELDVSEVS